MIRFLLQAGYNVAFFVAFIITWPYFSYRLWKRGHWWRGLEQRLGIYRKAVRQQLRNGSDIWIHAVSVGEVMLARVLIEKLREQNPNLTVVLSTTTATGYRVAERLADDKTVIVFNPIDFLWSVRSAFETFKPRRLIMIEAEIWANYIWCAKRRGIRIYLVNARLSSKSEERFRKFRWVTRPVMQEVDLIFAQCEEDVARLTRAGFASEAIFNVGSMKYDVANIPGSAPAEIDAWWSLLGWSQSTPILLAASTHPGEEVIISRIYTELRSQYPSLRLVIVPRHAERGTEVLGQCRDLGVKAVLRTELSSPLSNGSTPEALILNSTGELKSIYPKATLIFVGKSICGHGGQNFIEAAKLGAPIIVGPYMENFPQQTAEFVHRNALIQVENETQLAAQINELLGSEIKRRELGQRAFQTFHDNLGAGQKTAHMILDAIDADKTAKQN
jgi:3-deoxy-D-manno-octulosonic-acid transferase